MSGKLNYFLFNKRSDYERGFLSNMHAEDDRICAVTGGRNKAVFISRVLDSQEIEMHWHRLHLSMGGADHAVFRLSVYANNENSLIYEGERIKLSQFIRQEDLPVEDKLAAMEPYRQKQVTGTEDVLLHEVAGRYLWIAVEVYGQQNMKVLLSDIRISFPMQTWMNYLPEIYQETDYENTFLQRFLGIFQTIYEDREEYITNIAQYFNVDSTGMEMLRLMAGWLDIRESYIWSEEQLRRLLQNAVHMYKKRGTRQGIMEFVKLYTGEEPFIVENHQVKGFRRGEAHSSMEYLYGKNPYEFVVLVREECLHSAREEKTLRRIIEDVKPAHMQMRLITLKPYFFLGVYTYLGVNSVLGQYKDMSLDGHAVLPFAVLGAKDAINI